MNEPKTDVGDQVAKQQMMWVTMGGGNWYAIPAALVEMFLAAGADVRHSSEFDAHCARPGGPRSFVKDLD